MKARKDKPAGNSHDPDCGAMDIMSVIKQLDDLRNVKKDVANHAGDNSYFIRAFHRCFELGPFVAATPSDNVAGSFLSSTETGVLVIRKTSASTKHALVLKRFVVTQDSLKESPERVKPGDAVIWKTYFRHMDYPMTHGESNVTVPEIISSWDKFGPIFADLLETELNNVDTVMKTIRELEGHLAPDMMTEYATGGRYAPSTGR